MQSVAGSDPASPLVAFERRCFSRRVIVSKQQRTIALRHQNLKKPSPSPIAAGPSHHSPALLLRPVSHNDIGPEGAICLSVSLTCVPSLDTLCIRSVPPRRASPHVAPTLACTAKSIFAPSSQLLPLNAPA